MSVLNGEGLEDSCSERLGEGKADVAGLQPRSCMSLASLSSPTLLGIPDWRLVPPSGIGLPKVSTHVSGHGVVFWSGHLHARRDRRRRGR